MNLFSKNTGTNMNFTPHQNNIYASNPSGKFFSPFNLIIDDMERLILVNFEKDPDEHYNILEFQQACDKNEKRSFLVIAYRNDGAADVYHQADYPFASQASILNDVKFFVSPLENAKFEIKPDSLEVYFSFQDKMGREIKVKVNELRREKKQPFSLLAPVGVISRNPTSLPVYSLNEMSFTNQKHTQIDIEINNRKHKPDAFPLPLDFSKNYFTRYSADTFNVDWNRNYDGPLNPLFPINNKAEAQGTTYELINNNGHYEIKCMSTKNKEHNLDINFSPPIPDIACLKEDFSSDGNFTITTDKTPGTLSGVYFLKRLGDEISIKIHPKYGWQPNERRLILKFLFLFIKVFKQWPKSYVWNAKIKLDSSNLPMMKSSWKRI